MPIFEIKKGIVNRVKPTAFKYEKDLQRLIEQNLKVIFRCEFVATEFYTGNVHSGKIDTLALSEDQNPVIIEYKKVASSQLINQSLYYLHWIKDHKGDFQVAVNQRFGRSVEIDWADIRVICLAPEFKKYDLHAVQVMGANIELWQYKIYENNILNIEEVYRSRLTNDTGLSQNSGKNPVMVEAGRKAAITRKTANHTIDQHLKQRSDKVVELFELIRSYIIELDTSIEELPKKLYIAYKTSQNFVCLQLYKSKICLYLKLDPNEIQHKPKQGRDVSNIGHFGTGDYELTIKSIRDFNETKHLIDESLKNIGG